MDSINMMKDDIVSLSLHLTMVIDMILIVSETRLADLLKVSLWNKKFSIGVAASWALLLIKIGRKLPTK